MNGCQEGALPRSVNPAALRRAKGLRVFEVRVSPEVSEYDSLMLTQPLPKITDGRRVYVMKSVVTNLRIPCTKVSRE